jgi:hypothetical protein
MKKIFGSVRRALSSKQPSTSTPQLPTTSHPVPSTRSSNPNSISTVSGGVHKRRYARPRPQVRIDLLASRVAESFKEAVKEELNNQRQQQQHHRQGAPLDLSGFEFDFEKEQEAANANEQANIDNEEQTRVYSTITAGSKSIVIMDDTAAPALPIMPGALPSPPIDDELRNTLSLQHRRGTSIDARLAQDIVEDTATTRYSDLYKDPEPEPEPEPEPAAGPATEWQRTSRDSSIQRSVVTQRRSLSEGREQMHSFRRRGSTKASIARVSSLRRHASFNSGLSRHNAGTSIATFQTMSSDNDPFFLDRHPNGLAGPSRQLRRRPGGNLRDVDNVHDLEHIQRPHSTGSISTRTQSVATSVILRSDRFIQPVSDSGNRQEGEKENENPKKAISLVATHSSQPNLRPSFEAEVAKLAALPDDIDDDGGIESALMKLEGRYEKKSPDPSPRITVEPDVYTPTGMPNSSSNPSYVRSDQESSNANVDGALHRPLALPEQEGQGMYRLSGENFNRRAPGVQSAIESEDSYSSIPLLDRGLSDIAISQRTRTMESMASSAMPAPLKPNSPVTRYEQQAEQRVTSPDSSIEYVIETDSMKKIPKNGTMPPSSPPRESFLIDDEEHRESFLLDDDENLSDMSDESDMVTRSDGTSHGVRSFFDDEDPTPMDDDNHHLPTHPMRHPPTPPLTANRLNDPLPKVDTTVFERGLPTPGLTPTSRLNNQPFGYGNQSASQPVQPAIELQELKKDSTPPPPAHLPFVLAYDSETLAQQFTIVEKDALDEIDWKELIELRWKQSSPQIRDWVQYLRTQDARGCDVVIARFNLVVKWTISECLLTEAIEERARCIVKYIHIAAHARRLRNYATMYQITIALLSTDVSRLKKTWALIPAAELQTMRTLEGLVQPLRNFHNLRVEMETATVDDGCIPFIGQFLSSYCTPAHR